MVPEDWPWLMNLEVLVLGWAVDLLVVGLEDVDHGGQVIGSSLQAARGLEG